MILQSIFNCIRRTDSFVNNVAVLASGTALAQVIPILASPVLTRLYTPADFGTLAVFMALVSIFIPAVCGKYEVAMVLPKSQVQALHLLGISLRFAFIASLAFLCVIVLANESILSLLNAPQLAGWIYFAPLALFLTGLTMAMNYFANRYQDYSNIAKAKLLRSLSVIVTSIMLGIVGAGFLGLLAGVIVGISGMSIYLFYIYRAKLPLNLLTWGRAKAGLMKRYRDYPFFNASTGLLNGFQGAIPVFFLSHYFPESIVGYFALTQRVANAPLSFLSASISQVNLKKIVDLMNKQVDIRPYFFKVTAGLIAIVLLPTIILTIFSPALFALVFGEEWREAGCYMQILAPALAFRFVASTLSTTLGATQNNRLGAIWKVTAFIVTIVVFALFAPQENAVNLFMAVVVMDTILYLFYYFLIWKAAGTPNRMT